MIYIYMYISIQKKTHICRKIIAKHDFLFSYNILSNFLSALFPVRFCYKFFFAMRRDGPIQRRDQSQYKKC